MSPQTDTRQRIVDTARVLFHSRSYADVGVKEICDTAGVQKGSFYHFFPSKRDLALAVIDDFAVEWSHSILDRAFDPGIPPLARLDRLVEAVYEWQQDEWTAGGIMPGCPFGNLALEISTTEDVLRRKLSTIFSIFEARFRATLDEAVERGDIPPLDTRATATAMLAYLEGLMLIAKTRNEPALLRDFGAVLHQIRVPSSTEAH